MSRSTPFLAAYALAAGLACAGSEWPMFQCDVGHTGASPDTSITPPLKAAWTFSANGPIRAQPCVAAGTVFFGACDHKFYALEAATGRLKWSFIADNEFLSSPCVDGKGGVYVGCDDGYLYALNAADGALRWRCSLLVDPPAPLPVGGTSRYDPNGYPTWAPHAASAWNGAPNKPSNALLHAAPVVYDGMVFIGTGEQGGFGHFFAIDAASGRVRWMRQAWTHSMYRTFAGATSAPAIYKGTVLWASKTIEALDPFTGETLPAWPEENWSWVTNEQRYRVLFSSQISVSNDGVAVLWADKDGYHSGPLRAVDVNDNSTLWTGGGPLRRRQCALIHNGRTVAAFDRDGKRHAEPCLRSHDLYSGRLEWTTHTGAACTGVLCAANGYIFAATVEGEILALQAGSGKIEWRFKAGGPIQSSGAIADGMFFIGMEKGEFRAFAKE